MTTSLGGLCAPAPFDALLRKHDRPTPRYTSYPPVPAWQDDVDAAEYGRALAAIAARPSDPLALYVHLPFCAMRCLYCGCNAVVNTRRARVDAYLDRLVREMAMVGDACHGASHRVLELHLGGGTPNMLADDQFVRLDTELRRHFGLDAQTERSIEADPRQVTVAQLDTLVALGYSRISFGVQDLDAEVQHAIGRHQPLDVVEAAVREARAAGFASVNLDVMYGLPEQTPESFDATLDAVLSLDPERIAVFGYAHVPWMQPHQRAIREESLPKARLRLLLFRMAADRLERAGYVWIGLDHFAKPTDELAIALAEGRLTRNFMGYTVRRAPHLLGLGASAIGEADGRFVQNAAKLGDWEAAIDADRLPIVRGHRLTDDDRLRGEAIRTLMCDLELPRHFRQGALAAAWDRLAALAEDGVLTESAAGLRVTRLGRLVLRSLAAELDAAADAVATSTASPRLSRAI
jgi:oxygen-independent coproporphyrinogen-3 oxidase